MIELFIYQLSTIFHNFSQLFTTFHNFPQLSTTFHNFSQLSTTFLTFHNFLQFCTYALQSVAVRRTSSEKFAQRQPADIALALIDNQPADDNLIDKDESSDNEASEVSTDLED